VIEMAFDEPVRHGLADGGGPFRANREPNYRSALRTAVNIASLEEIYETWLNVAAILCRLVRILVSQR